MHCSNKLNLAESYLKKALSFNFSTEHIQHKQFNLSFHPVSSQKIQLGSSGSYKSLHYLKFVRTLIRMFLVIKKKKSIKMLPFQNKGP